MKAKVMIFPSEAQPSERASERMAPPSRGLHRERIERELDERKRTAAPAGGLWKNQLQIRRLEQMLSEMTIGMRNLREIWPKPWNYNARELAQAAKIRSVEAKLLKLKQGRLL